MTMSDPLGDMLTRIRNGQQAGKRVVECRVSRHQADVLEVMKNEGYIRAYDKESIELGYVEGQPVIQEMKRVSKPGRRIYKKVADMPRVKNGLGVLIVSTPRGVMTDSDARAANVGGEVLCSVY